MTTTTVNSAFQEMSEIVVVSNPRSQVAWSNLVGSDAYQIKLEWLNPTGSYQELRLFVNGDIDDSHWMRQGLAAFSGNVGADALAKAEVVACPTASRVAAEILVVRGIDNVVAVLSKEFRNQSVRLYSNLYSQSVTSITRLDLVCTDLVGIGVSSRFQLLKYQFPVTVESKQFITITSGVSVDE